MLVEVFLGLLVGVVCGFGEVRLFGKWEVEVFRVLTRRLWFFEKESRRVGDYYLFSVKLLI